MIYSIPRGCEVVTSVATTLCLVPRQTHRKVSRMTTTVNVERIDIIEGPNLEGLLQPWLMKEAIEDANKVFAIPDIHVRFEEVRYMRNEWTADEELGVTFHPLLVGIGLLGGDVKSRKRDDFIITVSSALGTFTGHYNTRTRKGSLARVK